MNDVDAVAAATPPYGAPFTGSWVVPAELAAGDYALAVEVAKEFDTNASNSYPSDQSALDMQFYSADGQHGNVGQPSVLFRIPFTLPAPARPQAPATSRATGTGAATTGDVNPPDDTISSDPGSGVGRLLLAGGAAGPARVSLSLGACSAVDCTATPAPVPQPVSFTASATQSGSWRTLAVLQSSESGGQPVVGYDVRYALLPSNAVIDATIVLRLDAGAAARRRRPGTSTTVEIEGLTPLHLRHRDQRARRLRQLRARRSRSSPRLPSSSPSSPAASSPPPPLAPTSARGGHPARPARRRDGPKRARQDRRRPLLPLVAAARQGAGALPSRPRPRPHGPPGYHPASDYPPGCYPLTPLEVPPSTSPRPRGSRATSPSTSGDLERPKTAARARQEGRLPNGLCRPLTSFLRGVGCLDFDAAYAPQKATCGPQSRIRRATFALPVRSCPSTGRSGPGTPGPERSCVADGSGGEGSGGPAAPKTP